MLGDTEVAEESQKRRGSLWWEEGLGWAGQSGIQGGAVQEGALPTTRVAAGSN